MPTIATRTRPTSMRTRLLTRDKGEADSTEDPTVDSRWSARTIPGDNSVSPQWACVLSKEGHCNFNKDDPLCLPPHD
ncbi:hypothetical protein M3J09_006137 [Ascochyta lentis]